LAHVGPASFSFLIWIPTDDGRRVFYHRNEICDIPLDKFVRLLDGIKQTEKVAAAA
jgi:hypothetical protein